MKEYRVANIENKTYVIFNDYNSAKNYIMDNMLADSNTYFYSMTNWMPTSHKSKNMRQALQFMVVDNEKRTASMKSMTIMEADKGSEIKADWSVEWRQ